MNTTRGRARVLRRLRAYYRLQARFYVRILGAFGIVPRPLAAAMLRRIRPVRTAEPVEHAGSR